MKHPTTRRTSLLLVLAAAFAVAGPASLSAQEAAEVELDPGETITVNTRLVTVTARATGPGARRLHASGLRIFADGTPQEVAFAEQDGASAVALLVDKSASMAGEPGKRLPYAVRAFVESADPRNDYTLIAFNDGVRVLGTYKGGSEGLARLLSALDGLPYSGSTALYDAILEARRIASAAPSRHKRALVVFTDAQDTASASRLEDLRAGLDSIGGLTFIVVMSQSFAVDPHRHDAPLPDPKLFEAASRFRAALDGEAYPVRTKRNIGDAARSIARTLRDAYQLAFYPTSDAGRGGAHTLRVESAVGGVTVRARSRYVIEEGVER